MAQPPHGITFPYWVVKVQKMDDYGGNMSIIAAYNDAWNNIDLDALAEILHDEFVFNPHAKNGIYVHKGRTNDGRI